MWRGWWGKRGGGGGGGVFWWVVGGGEGGSGGEGGGGGVGRLCLCVCVSMVQREVGTKEEGSRVGVGKGWKPASLGWHCARFNIYSVFFVSCFFPSFPLTCSSFFSPQDGDVEAF